MSIILPSTVSLLCPKLAEQATIITKENVDGLLLSTYSRTRGTQVSISCLAYPDFQVEGFNSLICLGTGQWDKPVPKCVFVQREGTSVASTPDISMLPMLVTAATAGVIILAIACIVGFVLCCWKNSGVNYRAHRKHGPIGLFRSLSMQEAESVFNERRHKYYAASDCSDVIDSISTRCPPTANILTPQMQQKSPFIYTSFRAPGTAHASSMMSYDQSDTKPRPPFYTARNKGNQHSLKTRVGTGQSYRTWHELFFDSNS